MFYTFPDEITVFKLYFYYCIHLWFVNTIKRRPASALIGWIGQLTTKVAVPLIKRLFSDKVHYIKEEFLELARSIREVKYLQYYYVYFAIFWRNFFMEDLIDSGYHSSFRCSKVSKELKGDFKTITHYSNAILLCWKHDGMSRILHLPNWLIWSDKPVMMVYTWRSQPEVTKVKRCPWRHRLALIRLPGWSSRPFTATLQ